MARDGEEDVGEVVGDAPGERAERLEFLRLKQLLLAITPLPRPSAPRPDSA
jgi:hypothetical protein